MRQNAKDFKDMASICGLRDGREVRRALARLEQGQLKRQEQKNILNFVFISYTSDPAQAKVDRSGNARARKKRTRIQHRVETLLQTYAHDPGLIEQDCSNPLDLRYNTLPKPEQDRAVALMREERFRTLTNTLSTTKLLIHGGARSAVSLEIRWGSNTGNVLPLELLGTRDREVDVAFVLALFGKYSDNIFIKGHGVPVLTLDGNGTIVSIGSTTNGKIYDGIKASDGELKLSFADKTPILEEQYLGGQINNFSSVGTIYTYSRDHED
ncbi:hypothetical protein SLS58_010547 [Diplodia intermedia]|uniref:Uncharacterized protein n=1 Tax=Diplodia intermedia TaxID=856260 RepID=A0ABR3T5G0_9PEZI